MRPPNPFRISRKGARFPGRDFGSYLGMRRSVGSAYAEVIGDPISQSQSPVIHRFWLERLRLKADYRATKVAAADLPAFLTERRNDRDWLGCSVTIPHKIAIMPLLDDVDGGAAAIGAVNCVVRRGGALIGVNTDVEGVGAAVGHLDFADCKAVVIGAGGAARSAVAFLGDLGAKLGIVARDPDRAARDMHGLAWIDAFVPMEQAGDQFRGADIIVNASPMGMAGSPEMPDGLLGALSAAAPGATAFDMVYKPRETAFLRTAAAAGLRTVGGLAMLVGQARNAFEGFYGAPPPRDGDDELIARLTA